MRSLFENVLKKAICVFLSVFLVITVLPFNVRRTYGLDESMPKISVIIPIYNTETYLEECIDSVIGQTFAQLEIILVDDGSTDGSLAIMKRFAEKDDRVKVLTQENLGGAAARNTGLKVATGDYIAFVDSDDTIDVQTYEKAYKKAEETGADIVMFGEDKFSPREKIYENSFEALNAPGAIFLWNKLYRREFLLSNNLLIPEHIKCHHDEAFNIMAVPKANRVACIQDRLYHYRRRRPGSIQTAVPISTRLENLLNVARFVCEDWRKSGYLEEHGYWLLRKLTRLFDCFVCRLATQEEKTYYSKVLMEIIGKDVYNENNIGRLRKSEQTRLANWVKYAQM